MTDKELLEHIAAQVGTLTQTVGNLTQDVGKLTQEVIATHALKPLRLHLCKIC